MFNISQQEIAGKGKIILGPPPMVGLTPFDNVRRCYYTV